MSDFDGEMSINPGTGLKKVSELLRMNSTLQNLDDRSALRLGDLALLVINRGAKGTLTVKIEISPEEGGANCIGIRTSMEVAEPKTPAARAIAFVGSEGEILRDDPYELQGPGWNPRSEDIPAPTGDAYDDHTGQALTVDQSTGVAQTPDERGPAQDL